MIITINQRIMYYNTCVKEVLKKKYNEKCNNKKYSPNILLKRELSFWSSFVNNNYSLITNDKNDVRILRKEILVVAEFELEKCHNRYIIRNNL